MFTWYNKNAPKNTIARYLSWKYTQLELAELTQLELPDKFAQVDYSNELALILQDSPWKISEVIYKTSSFSSLKGIFTKDYWFGKKELSSDSDSIASEVAETNSIQDLGSSIYYDPNSDLETNSVTSSETSESESAEKIITKGTYRYEFCTDDQGLILTWRTPTSHWRNDNFYQDKYFAADIAKYANSYLKVKTLAPIPETLPVRKYLFTPCQTEKEFYEQASNWNKCLVWEQTPLRQCVNCSTYLTPSQELITRCVSCSQKQETSSFRSEESEETFLDLWNLHRFTPEQKQEWLNVGFQENEANFCWWLQEVKRVSPEWVLNYGDQEELKKEHGNYLLNPLTTNWWENSQNLLILGGSLVVLGIILLNKD